MPENCRFMCSYNKNICFINTIAISTNQINIVNNIQYCKNFKSDDIIYF
jgi:hypothetical protein